MYLASYRKVDLPEMRDNDTNTTNFVQTEINIDLGKNEGYMPSSLGSRSISVGR